MNMTSEKAEAEINLTSATVVLILATPAEEDEVIAKLRQFAWDDPPVRFARISQHAVVADLREVAGHGVIARFQAVVGRPAWRTTRPEAAWRTIAADEEDG